MGDDASQLLHGLRSRDRRALSRTITELENQSDAGHKLEALLTASTASTFTVGITGPPGAGKSTLISALIAELTTRGHRTAVLLVDPSSPISGGAVLGDRIRMARATGSDDVYVRSFGNRGHAGGVIASAGPIVRAVSEAGFDVVIIETVGSGQSDIAITATAHCTICVAPPGLGDSVQALKAGIQEVADMFVVTKADLPGAKTVMRQLKGVPRRQGDERPRPVFATSSIDGDGIAALADELHLRRERSLGKETPHA